MVRRPPSRFPFGLPRGFAYATPIGLAIHPSGCRVRSLRHSITSLSPSGGAGIFACFPSATPFGLVLGTDSPWDDYHCPGNLGLTADGFFIRLFVTNSGILTSRRSSRPYGRPSLPLERSPTDPSRRTNPTASVLRLSPVTFSAQDCLTSELLRTL